MIEINRIADPLRIEGRVGRDEFVFFKRSDHWAFYVCETLNAERRQDIFAMSATFPASMIMTKVLAIRIAWACAKFYEDHYIMPAVP